MSNKFIDQSYDVIIPNYNRKDELLIAVNSVLKQTVPAKNIYIIDDGSDYETKKFYMNAITKLNRVKIIQLNHSGNVGYLRNIGVEAASSKFIAFIDSDDCWSENKIEIQFDELNQFIPDDIGMVCTNAYAEESKVRDTNLYIQSVETTHIFDFRKLVVENMVINSSTLIPRDFIGNIGSYPKISWLKFSEDYAFALKIALCSQVLFVNRPLLIYRKDSPDSLRNLKKPRISARVRALSYIAVWSVLNISLVRSKRNIFVLFAYLLGELIVIPVKRIVFGRLK
jgi:glycosyltransferase involved in cell wall biosynthesis